MKITIISVGKLKEKYWRAAIEEYQKRLSRYCSLTLLEVADEKCPDNAGEEDKNIIRRKEGERIKAKIPGDAHIVTMEIQGKEHDSLGFAQWLDRLPHEGHSHLVFIIGGSLGLTEELCRRSSLSLSFSRLTFPHQMMRVILLEQIYRAYRINRNEPYHK
ncbi:23S rRNA (pseudouridine(1915)-N(3))-methyltransferase RlmH [Oceanispirochaeta crateris]|uniref:Ribosomal RNA large subunit methyltransferase H n=1 Tax=Oceanispirochaeta crateris TaxID=2518645 RepID=A0A5C1QPZ7_9SPIO|nr:23S rRNA (pseudouridine(1915)-N(3))-methyltransferase RlmH [Oceanispirochaeta crateris]QEN08656.1 23S rRNA (pseudouridine(1915)-N(3))-methyltransferase RlmH [Oceanispirochaeta crateris]